MSTKEMRRRPGFCPLEQGKAQDVGGSHTTKRRLGLLTQSRAPAVEWRRSGGTPGPTVSML